jgi:hypothetical protein
MENKLKSFKEFLNEQFDVISHVKSEKEVLKILKEKNIDFKSKKKIDAFGGRISYRNKFNISVAVWHKSLNKLEIFT